MSKIFLNQTQLRTLIDDNTIIKCGYCQLQNLLGDVEPLFYYKNSLGWCCDIYRIEKHNIRDMSIEVTYIISGYDTLKQVFNNNTYNISYFDSKYYNDLAQGFCDNEVRKNTMRTLIYEMIDHVTRNL